MNCESDKLYKALSQPTDFRQPKDTPDQGKMDPVERAIRAATVGRGYDPAGSSADGPPQEGTAAGLAATIEGLLHRLEKSVAELTTRVDILAGTEPTPAANEGAFPGDRNGWFEIAQQRLNHAHWHAGNLEHQLERLARVIG